MIDTTELRIGNWVYYENRSGWTPFRVISINEHGIDLYATESQEVEPGLDGRHLEPIGLTPELLKKCGFVWNKIYQRWIHGFGIKLIQYESNFYYSFGDETFLPPKLDALHKLQNLVFALTGRELQIDISEL